MVGGWGAVGCAGSVTGDGSPPGVEVCSGSGVGAGSVGIGAGVGRTNGVSSSCGCDDAALASSALMAAPVSSGWSSAGAGSGSSASSVRSPCGSAIASGVGSVKSSESGVGCGEACIDSSWSLSSCSIILDISGCGSWLSGWITRSPPWLVGCIDGDEDGAVGCGKVSVGVVGAASGDGVGASSETGGCSTSGAGVGAGSAGVAGSVAVCSVGADGAAGVGAALGRTNGAGSVAGGVELSGLA